MSHQPLCDVLMILLGVGLLFALWVWRWLRVRCPQPFCRSSRVRRGVRVGECQLYRCGQCGKVWVE